MQIVVKDYATGCLVCEVFRRLPGRERKHIEAEIAAITDAVLTTAVRPFMFGGKVVHELYFDPSKLLLFTGEEKTGAVVSAFIISILAQNGDAPLSDQSLRTHSKQIAHYAKSLEHGSEVSAFLRKFRTLEDEWRRNVFPEIRN